MNKVTVVLARTGTGTGGWELTECRLRQNVAVASAGDRNISLRVVRSLHAK